MGELAPGLFLFQFYRKEDKQWVLNGGPWSFDNVMLVLESVKAGQNPVEVKPCFLHIWIQLHNLPVDYMLETVGKQLGNFLVSSWSMTLKTVLQYGVIA